MNSSDGLPSSDMIDGAEPGAGCIDEDGNPLTTDQRGMPGNVGARCDIGAVEYSDVIFKNGFDPTPQGLARTPGSHSLAGSAHAFHAGSTRRVTIEDVQCEHSFFVPPPR